ncbi:unannotated protein [freshwater metagenome]|uniref:precorrin-2 dehydrogenase n=1 Tax=freshwater metagenome TaxID=449393 RepID=A0A6J6TFV2_9ZZZZ|nr:hypothetical protein [Actinomycetota bacterium]MSY79397.1 hypothetical protein [Actinomycetota bacterium]MTA64406.1 hypothetical protein [Actinomycetota bacterium]
MAETSQLSVQLRVQGRRCVVVGGGPVALRRATLLLQAGADLTVIAPELHVGFDELAELNAVQIERREFRPADLVSAEKQRGGGEQPMLLVVAATDNPKVNERVGELCSAAGILVNRADLAQAGDLSFPALVNFGAVTLAVSNSVGSPALSQWVAERVDASLESVLGLTAEQGQQFAQLISEVRQELRASQNPNDENCRDVTSSVPDWRSALDESILVLVRMGRCAEAKERLLACLSS